MTNGKFDMFTRNTITCWVAIARPAVCILSVATSLLWSNPASAEIPEFALSSFSPASIDTLALRGMNDREEVLAYDPVPGAIQGVKFSPLGAPERSRVNFPTRINSLGQIVGSYAGTFWGILGTSLNPGGMTFLRDILGALDHVSADAINDHGVIAGGDYLGQVCAAGSAYILSPSTGAVDCVNAPAGFDLLGVADINAAGDIVGVAVKFKPGARSQAYVRRAGQPLALIPTPDGFNSQARGISAAGEFVVSIFDDSLIVYRTALVRSEEPHVLENFPPFPGRYGPAVFDPLGVNDLGLVVGTSRHGEPAIFNPEDQKYRALADLIVPADGFANIQLSFSVAHSPSGKIAVVISHDDGTGVAVFRPVKSQGSINAKAAMNCPDGEC